MINNNLIYLSLLFSAALLLLLCFLPELDLIFSSFFYNSNSNFVYKNIFIVKLLYLSIPVTTKFFVIILAIYLIYSLIKTKNIKNLYKSKASFLILAALAGPGLMVNSALKNYHGRARPAQIIQFGGNKVFTNPILYSDQCSSNCSFPSGHSAMAFYFSALAYILHKEETIKFNRLYITGLLFGCLVGFSRIVMGGHFLSDVVASCLIVLTLNHIIYLIWKKYA